jgi:ATP-dependent phosphoenolpyruvate carboxykinase
LLNTGGVGEGTTYKDITLADTMGILDSLFRGGTDEWQYSSKTGLIVPNSVRAVDSILMHPEKLFPADDFDARQQAPDRHRAEYMDKYRGLVPQISAVFQSKEFFMEYAEPL